MEDSGIGIAKNVIPILFQAFQQADTTTSREHGGTGLGLAISKSVMSIHTQNCRVSADVSGRQLIELMDGTVNLESDLGKGTKITVVVPFAKSARTAAKVLRRPSQRSRGSGSSNSSLTAAATSPDVTPQRTLSDDARSSRSSRGPSPTISENGDGVMMAATAANQQSSLTGAGLAGALEGAHSSAEAAAAGAGAVSSPPLNDIALARPLLKPERLLSQQQTSFATVTSSHDSDSFPAPPSAAENVKSTKQEIKTSKQSAAVPLDRSSIWILLAEDNELNAEIFTRGMKRMGFNVKAVGNGKEFLDALPEREWDLALLDCHMPVSLDTI